MMQLEKEKGEMLKGRNVGAKKELRVEQYVCVCKREREEKRESAFMTKYFRS